MGVVISTEYLKGGHLLFPPQVLVIASLVAAASAAPQYAAAPVVVKATGDLAEPPVYAYNYGVNDDYSGAQFSQNEQRDGYATSGSYTVALPDGRVQTVKYADNGDGVTQEVTYEGVAGNYGPAPVKVVAHAPVTVAHAPVVHHAVAHAPLVHSVAHAPIISHAPFTIAPPTIAHPALAHPALSHPALAHPAFAHPAISHPALAHPTFAHPALAHPLTLAHPSVAVSHLG